MTPPVFTPELRAEMRTAAEAAQADRERVNAAEERGEKLWASIDVVHAFSAAWCPAKALAMDAALTAAEAEITRLKQEMATREQMLEDCYRQFNWYADEHEKAGKLAKMRTNRGFADRIKSALAPPQEGSGDE